MEQKKEIGSVPQFKGKYSREELVIKFQMREYDLAEFEDLTVVKELSMYTIYEAKKHFMNVLLFKMKGLDRKTMKNIISSTKIFMVKSKYLLPRLGFVSDYYTDAFYTVYEKPKGELFDFDSLPKSNQSTLIKLYLYDIIAKLCDRLKKHLTDEFKLGVLRPDFFYFNIHDEVPLKLIDFYFFPYFHLSNNDKAKNFLRPFYGIYEVSSAQPDDIASMKIMLAHAFDESKPKIPYNIVISKYSLEANTKEDLKHANRSREGARPDEFEKYVSLIKHPRIRQFILDFTKDNISIKYGQDVKYTFQSFYEIAFLPMLKEIIREHKCNREGCKFQAEVIVPFCFEALCKQCSKKHKCDAIFFNELYNIYDGLPSFNQKLDTVRDDLIAIPAAREVEFVDVFMERDYPIHTTIKNNIRKLKKKIKATELYLNFMGQHIEKCFRIAVEKRIERVEKVLDSCKSFDRVVKAGITKELKDIEDLIISTRNSFDELAAELGIYNSLYECLPSVLNYDEYLQNFFYNYLEYSVNDITLSVKREISKLDINENPIIKDITHLEPILDFHVPFPGTDLLIRLYDISIVDKKAVWKTTKEKLTFSKKIANQNIIPNHSRYCRLKDCIIVTGGMYEGEDMKDQIDQTLAISIKNKKVKRRDDMKNARKNHSLIAYNEFFVIAVGGENNATCEMYSYLNDQWMDLPDLNIERANSTLFLHNNCYLYCFGGQKGSNYIETYDFVEKLDVTIIENWKMVDFKIYSNDVNISGINFGICQKDNNVLFILGGKMYDERDGQSVGNEVVYEYNLKKNKIRMLDITIDKGYYLESYFIDIGLRDYKFQVYFDELDTPQIMNFKV